MAINFTNKSGTLVQFIRAPRCLEQHRRRSFGQRAAGGATGAGLTSCAILALLMLCFGSTGAIKAAESADAVKQRAWRESLSQAPLPKKGCFEAKYPDTQWREVPCKAVPLKPYVPARGAGPRPGIVGGTATNDISAQAPTGHISSATGSFDSATVTSEITSPDTSSCAPPPHPPSANTFSLQLNTNTSPTSPLAAACNGGSAQCVAWQQFVYTSNGSGQGAFVMQYWLINYGTETNQTCPAGGPAESGPSSTTPTCARPPSNTSTIATGTAPAPRRLTPSRRSTSWGR